MATRRKLKDLSPWPALLLEGQLLTASTVQKVVDQDADHQLPTDYGLHKNMNLRNEIDIRFRLGQTRYQAFVGSKNTQADSVTIGLGETKRFVTDLLHETLSFDDLSPGEIPLAAIAGQGRIPVVVCDPQHKLDERTDALSTTRSQSANTALQDYLNDQEEALWGIACNGHTLRLMRDNESLTRPAYVEFNLQHIFENEDVSSFAALWMLLHRSRFGVADAPVTDCSLERWKEQGTKDGEAIRDDLAKQVTEALKALGSGFLNDNASLRENLTSQGEIDLVDFFNELLRLVYRLIFLMVAEDRNLLHHPNKSTQVARKLYADGYGTQQLREISLQRDARDKYSDRYEALKIVLEALSETDATRRDILGLPALGGLFGAGRSPILEGLVLSNEALLRAVYKLGYFKRDEATTAVNWGQMETEELGSVYESLLELQPQLGPFGKTLQFANEVAEKKGNQRKTTGSYYTPDSLVQALLDTALDPVLERIEKEANSETEAAERMLALTVIDPACGSGHFLLAAARRMATRIARLRHEGTPSLADYRHALREVARGCLYGVDRNPMAVELAQVALWIETIDPGYPLGFFDAQIRCGDSLLGVFDLEVLEDGIPDGAYKALTGDDKEIAKYYKNVNKKYRDNKATEFDFAGGDIGVGLSAKPVVKSFASMFRMPEEELWQVRKKAARYVELRESEEFQKLYHSADLYIGAFLTPKVGEQPTGASAHTIPTTIELYQALAGNPLPQYLSPAVDASRKARAFHWPLEFPHVMEAGGFDVVLGNPPFGAKVSAPARAYHKESMTKSKKAGNTAADFMIVSTAYLLSPNGTFSLIVPKGVTYSNSWLGVREYLLPKTLSVLDIGKYWDNVNLEMVVWTATNKRSVDTVRLNRDLESDGYEMNWRSISELAIIPTGADKLDFKILGAIKQKPVNTKILKTSRGGNLQKIARSHGDLRLIGGRDLSTNGIKQADSSTRYIESSMVGTTHIVEPGTILMQNIVAHITEPVDHIKLIGSINTEAVAVLDTVNVIKYDPAYDPEALLCYLMSPFVCWYVYVFGYNRAIRTMHFDNFIVNNIPLPPPKVVNKLSLDLHDGKKVWNHRSSMLSLKHITDYFDLKAHQRAYIASKINL
jgi:type I restriction-modification system DNA methylase subunit